MYCFDKAQRLITKADYKFVFDEAKKTVSSDFIVLYRSNSLNHARLGLAISKKAIAKAHDRNRIKRLIRESFRKTTLPCVDIIFLARQGVGKLSNAAINTTLSKTWNKLRSSS